MSVWILMLLAMLILGGCSHPADEVSLSGKTNEEGGSREVSMELSMEELLGGTPRDYSLLDASGEPAGDTVISERVPETEEEMIYTGEFLVKGSTYMYDSLSAAEKIWYRDMENILGDMAPKGKLSMEGVRFGLEKEDIDYLFQCVMLDHPELFFVEGYSCNYCTTGLSRKLLSIEFSGKYNVDREKARIKKQEIEKAAGEILAGAPKDGDDYEKIKYIYETLIRRTEYSVSSPDNQNLYSVLVGGVSVCQGYAKATQYLLNRMGVECLLVQGTVHGGQRHGWNLVKSNEAYYYVDTTWGDASYTSPGGVSIDVGQEINYDYLLVTTQELQRTHQLDDMMIMPVCTATKDNYFVREDAYFTQWDETRIRNLFSRSTGENSYFVTLKCSGKECYDEIFRRLITQNTIFDYYGAAQGSVAYTQNENQFTMTFWMTSD